MPREVIPPCRECGACCCCLIEMDFYCEVEEADLPHLSPRFKKKWVTPKMKVHDDRMGIRAKWVEARTGPCAGLRLNVCAALRGSPLSRVSCSIYENRPSICFEFVRGEWSCREAISTLRSEVEEVREECARTIPRTGTGT